MQSSLCLRWRRVLRKVSGRSDLLTMAHARRVIEAWRIEYNTERPHSSLGNLTPEQFVKNALKSTAQEDSWSHQIA
jgi:transposase InsO family protein